MDGYFEVDGLDVLPQEGEWIDTVPGMRSPKWGRLSDSEYILSEMSSPVISGGNVSSIKKIVRFQTPSSYSWRVLKSRNYLVSFLLWCIAWTRCSSPEKRDVFERRLAGFLGPKHIRLFL